MIRSAWVVMKYVQTLHLMNEGEGRPLTKDEQDLYSSYESCLANELAGYRATISGDGDETLWRRVCRPA